MKSAFLGHNVSFKEWFVDEQSLKWM
jgi:hypothetical protein